MGAEKKELGRAITHDFGRTEDERDRISVRSVPATASAASCRDRRTPLYLFVGELRIKGGIADLLGSDGESESGLGRQLGGRFTAAVPGRLQQAGVEACSVGAARGGASEMNLATKRQDVVAGCSPVETAGRRIAGVCLIGETAHRYNRERDFQISPARSFLCDIHFDCSCA